MKKCFTGIVLIALLCCYAVGCGSESATPSEGGSGVSPSPEAADSAILLKESSIEADRDRVTVEGTAATVTAAGTYEITGKLENGQIIVDTEGMVTLIFNNIDIYCETSAPVYVKKAKHITIILAEHSENQLTDGSAYTFADVTAEPDAVLFSKADMTIGGSGSLTVSANYNDGIASKDTLQIDNGKISVTARNHGIKGKDFLLIGGGEITVNAGGDGIKSTNDKDASLGYVKVSGGTLLITAQDEGISAVTDVKVTGGSICIETANNGIKTNGTIDVSAGSVAIQTEDKGLLCAEQKIDTAAAVTVNGEAVSGN